MWPKNSVTADIHLQLPHSLGATSNQCYNYKRWRGNQSSAERRKCLSEARSRSSSDTPRQSGILFLDPDDFVIILYLLN